jgi:multiple sugar transport system substrate-binding protein
VANGKMEETMMVTGHALFDFVHSNQLVAIQNLVPDELAITMIPGQKDGKPGQYLKPSMLLSMAATAPEPEAAAKLMAFFLTDESANDILLIERGVSGDASIRERISANLTDTEKKIISYLDVVATHVSPLPPPPPKNAGELDRALAPAWESVAFKKVDVQTAAKDYYENAKAVLARA